MEFRRASFVFSCPGVDLRGSDQILGPPGQHFGLGTLWVDFGVPKNTLLRGNDFVVGIQGNPFCPNEFYGPWDPFGCATLPRNLLIQLFSFPGKLQVVPVPTLLSLVVLLAAYFPLVGTLGCRKRLP